MRISLFLLLCMAQAWGQSFEVASVKPVPAGESRPNTTGAGLVKQDAGRVSYSDISFMSLLNRAYGVERGQIHGPDWMSDQRYEVIAKIPEGGKPEQVPIMLQHLLEQRFRMTVRHETRTEKGSALVVAPGGTKLPKPDAPDANPSLSMGSKTELRASTMAELAHFLAVSLKRPVEDGTKVDSRYTLTFDLSFADLMEFEKGNQAALPEMNDSLRRLGLRLEPKSLEVHHLIVEKAEKKPIEN